MLIKASTDHGSHNTQRTAVNLKSLKHQSRYCHERKCEGVG